MDSTVSGQIPDLSSNAFFTASPGSKGFNSQSTSPGGTAVKIVSEVASPLSITTFEESPECLICRKEICLNKRNISQPEITYCESLHTYHQKCIIDFYTRNPDQQAPHKNPDLKCFKCHKPMPLSMPRWDGEAFICPIRKSELDANTPYVGPPMTFSLADYPLIDAQEVTVALGFKGAPTIRILDASRKPQEDDPLQGDYIVCHENLILNWQTHFPNRDKPSNYNFARHAAASWLSDITGESCQHLLQTVSEIFPERPDGDKNTPSIEITCSIESSNDKKVYSFASNYPIYPLEWCKPATQRMACLEKTKDISESFPVFLDGSDTDQPAQKRKKIESSTTDGENRARHVCSIADECLVQNSTQDSGQPIEENSDPQLDTLSFEISVTTPGSNDCPIRCYDMNFSNSKSIRFVFTDDRSPSSRLMLSSRYEEFKTNFQRAMSNMGEGDELLVRVKLKKPSDSTKTQEMEPSPSEPLLGQDDTDEIFEEMKRLEKIMLKKIRENR
ncbi:hypothetical protein [Salinisphaera sp. G21_0]|uniref:hypothetical protein n=1 Tax=Salinisphaera sp. G21_0 TaxID=2821094 RepID=UPI001ADBBBAE|nr:hypothetical protein [Salinisphaera sp. G21_0]MBO9481740.1 hypothetical protein [Salinisphaera sp. G21_0]